MSTLLFGRVRQWLGFILRIAVLGHKDLSLQLRSDYGGVPEIKQRNSGRDRDVA